MRTTHVMAVLGTCAALALGGCSTVSDALGAGKDAPDEFAVVTKAPLVMPPDFSLRPPQPGARGPSEISARTQAEAALIGAGGVSGGFSASEQTLLGRAGAASDQSAIRDDLAGDELRYRTDNQSFVGAVLGTTPAEPNPVVVDPQAEAERLKREQATGQPVDGSQTPTVEERPSIWDRLF